MSQELAERIASQGNVSFLILWAFIIVFLLSDDSLDCGGERRRKLSFLVSCIMCETLCSFFVHLITLLLLTILQNSHYLTDLIYISFTSLPTFLSLGKLFKAILSFYTTFRSFHYQIIHGDYSNILPRKQSRMRFFILKCFIILSRNI